VPASENTDHLRIAMFTDLLVYDYAGEPPEHPDKREADDLRKQADWLIERGWTKAGEEARNDARL
jgi:hypothetical protein